MEEKLTSRGSDAVSAMLREYACLTPVLTARNGVPAVKQPAEIAGWIVRLHDDGSLRARSGDAARTRPRLIHARRAG